jgi:hypothetical protein
MAHIVLVLRLPKVVSHWIATLRIITMASEDYMTTLAREQALESLANLIKDTRDSVSKILNLENTATSVDWDKVRDIADQSASSLAIQVAAICQE